MHAPVFRHRVLLRLASLIAGASATALGGAAETTASMSDSAVWRATMRQITPASYVCRHLASPPKIDGDLGDAAWDDIPWTADFVDIQPLRPRPGLRTRAKIAWDDEYLYIAAELEEPHVWANQVAHDSVIFQDPDFEVFIDPDGDTHNYTEFEMNARNTTWDLLLDKPYQDQGKPHNEWEIPGTKTAVQVHGTINDPSDIDQGWTLEIAFPWSSLSRHARHSGAPREGEQWRLNFSRVEWSVSVEPPQYRKLPGVPEANWVWSPQGVIDMHRPEMWGVVQFTRKPADIPVTVAPIPGKPARDLVLDLYYAQRDYAAQHQGAWARTLDALGWSCDVARVGLELPLQETTPEGTVYRDSFVENGERVTWTLRPDRLLTCERTPEPKDSTAEK